MALTEIPSLPYEDVSSARIEVLPGEVEPFAAAARAELRSTDGALASREEPPAPRLAPVERYAPTAIFAIITLFLAFDLVDDITRKKGPWHLGGMAVGIALSIGGLVLMLRVLSASRARAHDLETVLDRTRADSLKWREQASQILRGLGAIIDEQFGAWGLSPCEREVALLLLKGLALKEIAATRNASEPTVRQQAQAIYRKAGLSGRADLAAFFLEDLLLPPHTAMDTPSNLAAPAKRE